MQAWMRKLIVTLVTADKGSIQRTLTFGENDFDDDQLAISIKGTKYLSPMKDEFTVIVKNIPLSSNELSMDAIKDTNFRYIYIEAGYQENSMQIFNGYIVYISSKHEDNGKTMSMSIVCSGSYTFNNLQNTKTFTIAKGTTYRDALRAAARLSGISDSQINIVKTLRFKRLTKNITFDGSIMSMIIELQNQDRNLLCHCDYTSDSKFQVWDATMTSQRCMTLTINDIILVNGFPTIEDQGVRFTCLPTFNFIPGDEIIFNESSFINRSIDSLNAYISNPYPDVYVGAVSPLETNPEKIKYAESVKGHYIIKELSYSLENRGQAYNVQVKCYAKNLYNSIAQNWQ